MRWPAAVLAATLALATSCGTSGADVDDAGDPVAPSSTGSAPAPAPADVRRTTPTTTTITPSTTTTTTAVSAITTSLPALDADSLPRSGAGTFERATAVEFAVEGEPLISFSIAVEDGSGVDLDELTRFVTTTLGDERSWAGQGVGFRLVDGGGQFTLAVATPDTVDELCRPLRTNGRFSCARNGWIALNLVRWMTATEDWPTDLDTYRRYLVNHEVGHYVLGPDHPGCPAEGMPAPIMMQQTKGLDGCEPNGWVDPG